MSFISPVSFSFIVSPDVVCGVKMVVSPSLMLMLLFILFVMSMNCVLLFVWIGILVVFSFILSLLNLFSKVLSEFFCVL